MKVYVKEEWAAIVREAKVVYVPQWHGVNDGSFNAPTFWQFR